MYHPLRGVIRHCHDLSGGDAAVMRRCDMPRPHAVAGEAGDQFGNALLAHALPLSPQLDAPLYDVAERPIGQSAGADRFSDALPYDGAEHGRTWGDASDRNPLLDLGT